MTLNGPDASHASPLASTMVLHVAFVEPGRTRLNGSRTWLGLRRSGLQAGARKKSLKLGEAAEPVEQWLDGQ